MPNAVPTSKTVVAVLVQDTWPIWDGGRAFEDWLKNAVRAAPSSKPNPGCLFPDQGGTAKDRQERTLSLWQRQEIQEVL
jgi:hypothetical protein